MKGKLCLIDKPNAIEWKQDDNVCLADKQIRPTIIKYFWLTQREQNSMQQQFF